MTKRYLSTFLFYKEELIRNCVIGLDDTCTITEIIQMDNQMQETSHTLFYDGIISGEIINKNCSLPDLNGKDEFLKFFKDNTLPIELNRRNKIVLWKNINHIKWYFNSKSMPVEIK